MRESSTRRETVEHPIGNEVEERERDSSRTSLEVDLFTERESADSGRDGKETESGPQKSFGNILKDQELKGPGAGPNKGNPSVKKRKTGGRIRLFIVILTGISLGLFFGYFHLKYSLLGSKGPDNKKKESVPEKRHFPILKEETITFDSFIVPFRENKRFTYISLSIVFSLPNKEISREMSRKRDYIRGILYDMFTEEINRANNIPPIDHLKESIIRTVNRVLSTGVVKEVFITQFLAV
jgi:flagellar basal body-associated protein FliL